MAVKRRLEYFDLSAASLWLDPIDLFLAAQACSLDISHKESLHVLEIGVYRGSWIFSLARNVRNVDRLVGIDPYPGDLARYRQELPVRAAENGLTDVFMHYDSWEDMEDAEADDQGRHKFDLIHVDGDHTYSTVRKDLINAAAWLSPDGLLIVDDFFNPQYSGIAPATGDFLKDHDFVIFMATRNKAYLCREPHLAEWQSRFERILTESPLRFSVSSWREFADPWLCFPQLREESGGLLLCLDEENRTQLLPSSSDRIVRKLARDWIPPKLLAVAQNRRAKR